MSLEVAAKIGCLGFSWKNQMYQNFTCTTWRFKNQLLDQNYSLIINLLITNIKTKNSNNLVFIIYLFTLNGKIAQSDF